MEARLQQRKRDHPDGYNGYNGVRPFIEDVAQPITKMREKHIDPKILKRYHISLQSLSFTTGGFPGGGLSFFEPVPPSQIGKWLARINPAIITEDFAFPDVKTAPIPNSPLIEAVRLLAIAETHLDRMDDEASNPCDLLYQTNWHRRRNNIYTLNRRGKSYGNWQVQMFYACHVGPNKSDKQDPMKPHITCFLADDAPLREDVISTSELVTIVVLACKHACTSMYEHSPYFPVTVVSGSGRHVRIVQGILDACHGSLELRMSRIISFEKGIAANRENFLTLLGWVVAKPVGTSPEHRVKQRSSASPRAARSST